MEVSKPQYQETTLTLSKNPLKLKIDAQCKICSVSFSAQRKTDKICSSACRKEAHRCAARKSALKHKESKKEYDKKYWKNNRDKINKRRVCDNLLLRVLKAHVRT